MSSLHGCSDEWACPLPVLYSTHVGQGQLDQVGRSREVLCFLQSNQRSPKEKQQHTGSADMADSMQQNWLKVQSLEYLHRNNTCI